MELAVITLLLLTFSSRFVTIQSDFQNGFCQSHDIETKCKSAENFLDGYFRAAVLEHDGAEMSSGEEDVAKNLAIFAEAAKLASMNRAKIIVFPEDGVFMGPLDYIRERVTEIPNPDDLDQDKRNPCNQPELFASSDILRNLSCIARNNQIYVAANFGTKETCQPGKSVGTRGKTCPEVGYLALNTDVVIDSQGNFIKRYRKYNLFIEVFDDSPSLDVSFFDTPFGRFGIFTCFDMLFRDPALELVKKHGVDTILFPTWWYDELPIFGAVQFQNGWSWTYNVNLLAANMHRLDLGSTGSGIYSNCGSNYYSAAKVPNPRLLISNLPMRPSRSKCPSSADPLVIDMERNRPLRDYQYKNYSLLPSDKIFLLGKSQEEREVCSGRVCCTLKYKMNGLAGSDKLSKMILIVRDSLRRAPFQWFEQVCMLGTLDNPFNPDNLSENYFSKEGLLQFEELRMEGKFTTDHVYPLASYNVSELISRHDLKYVCTNELEAGKSNNCQLILLANEHSTNRDIFAFGFFARVYEEDKMGRD